MIVQDLLESHYTILLIIFLKKFLKLNVNMDRIINNVKRVELNSNIASVILNIQKLKII